MASFRHLEWEHSSNKLLLENSEGRLAATRAQRDWKVFFMREKISKLIHQGGRYNQMHKENRLKERDNRSDRKNNNS